MKNLRIALLLLASMLGAACDKIEYEKATQLLVTVSGDVNATGEVASIEAQLFDLNEVKHGEPQKLPGAQLPAPISFAVSLATKAPIYEVVIVVTAKNAEGGIVAQNKAQTTFVLEKIVWIELKLNQVCRGLLCPARQTCVASGPGSGLCGVIPAGGRQLEGGFDAGAELSATFGSAISGDGDGAVSGSGEAGTPGTNPGGGDTSMSGGSDGGSPGTGGPGGGGDASTPDAAAALECDATNACTAGYMCMAGKCVSACEGTTCDPNATCTLMGGAPMCICGSDYLAQPGAGGAVTCLKNTTCTELRCDANAMCGVVAGPLPECTCKPGYTGNGMTCTPISCGPLDLTNGTVTTGGATFGQTATYTCNAGYTKTGGTARKCEVGGWSGIAPTCVARDCGRLTSPSRGSIDYSGTTFPDGRATYRCEPGFTISGTATRTCGATGWSGSEPRCLGCGDGVVSAGEQCDVLDLFGAPVETWSCIKCQRVTAYTTRCTGSTATDRCPAGTVCQPSLVCAPTCPSGSSRDCPAIPRDAAPVYVSCLMSGTASMCMLNGCANNADCPTGQTCLADSSGTSTCAGL